MDANNCVQHVFEKIHLFHNDISPHLKSYYPMEGLIFVDFEKKD